MREIKLRAWDIERCKFYPVRAVLFKLGKVQIQLSESDGYPEGTWTVVKLENVELVEYTGMKDKNGVEIYEGDILFHPLQGKRKVFYPYSETVASYGLRNVDNGMGSTLQDAHRVWEIIGNIYENPELLEEV